MAGFQNNPETKKKEWLDSRKRHVLRVVAGLKAALMTSYSGKGRRKTIQEERSLLLSAPCGVE